MDETSQVVQLTNEDIERLLIMVHPDDTNTMITNKQLGMALRELMIYRLGPTPTEIKEYQESVLRLTETLSEHPDWWDYPCLCTSCQSYCAD